MVLNATALLNDFVEGRIIDAILGVYTTGVIGNWFYSICYVVIMVASIIKTKHAGASLIISLVLTGLMNSYFPDSFRLFLFVFNVFLLAGTVMQSMFRG